MAASSPAHDSTNFRYGIIGSGMMGTEHMLNVAAIDGAVVTAIADPNAKSRHLAKKYGSPAEGLVEFDDYRELLTSGLCDAVVVASPNFTHVDVMADLFAAAPSMHVLVEKPLCTTVADCERLIDLSAGHHGVVWVGLEYRYMPPVQRLVEAVHRGDVGRPHMMAIREHRYPFLPKVDDWNRFNRNTGGTLVEKCCHFFDLMHHVLQAEPVQVMASGGQSVNHLDEQYHGEVPDILDNAFVIVDFDNGARAMLDLCMFAEGTHEQEELSVVGDLGKVEAFLPSSEFRFGLRTGGHNGVDRSTVEAPEVKYEGFHHGSSYLEHLDFIAACRGGTTPGVTLADGLRSVAMGAAAHQSIDQSRPIPLPPWVH